MVGEPRYDEDVVNLGYLNSVLGKLNTELGDTNELLFSKSQNFGTLPQPPYRRYDTYMGPDGIYICHTERLIGEYNSADWGKASTYENVGDAFDRGIITAGTLQAVNSGTNTAGLTGEGTGDSAIRFWAGSTYAGRGSAPFRVTQGGALYATSGSISGNLVTSGIDASNITAGTISTSRLNSDVITTSNFSAQNINADRITSGTITGRAISGGSININNQFKVNTSGLVELTTGAGYFSMGKATTHPWLSGVNVNRGNGIQFYSGESVGSIESYSGAISFSGSAMYITANGTVNINRSGGNVGIQSVVFSGNNLSTSDGADITIGSHLTLRSASSSYGVYARGLEVKSNSSVTTNSGQASSRNVKTNIEKFDTDKYKKALCILNELELYDYDYKYSLYKNNKQYGFIIDEIEEIEGYEEFFDFYKSEAIIEDDGGLNFAVEEDLPGDRIEVKQYQPDVLDKYLLTVCKSLHQEINKLKEEIEDLKGGK